MEVLEEVKQQNIEENQPLDPLENVSERSSDESSFLEDNRQINEDVSVYSDNEVTSENSISGKVLIKERYEIDFYNHLSWLDNNNAPAYAVTDRIDATKKLFALICPCDTAPRLSILSFLKSTYIPNLKDTLAKLFVQADINCDNPKMQGPIYLLERLKNKLEETQN